MIKYLMSFLVFMTPLLFADMDESSARILEGAVVISLNRHVHRFEKTKALMQNAGFTNVQKFEAIDGFFTEDSFFANLGIFGGSRGQKGCAASHLLIWKNFVKNSDKEYLFIAEDDMLPHSDFANLFPVYWEKTPKNFDIVMVGNQIGCTMKEKHRINENFIVTKPSNCLHAYIISKKGAIKLLKLYKKMALLDFRRHLKMSDRDENQYVIDIFTSKLMFKKRITYYCYNGRMFPDAVNRTKGNIVGKRDSGICFQNAHLGSSIHAVEIVPQI